MLIPIEEVWNVIDRETAPVATQSFAADDALGLVLREDVRAEVDQPRFDLSEVDGFAFASETPGLCRIAGMIAAGEPPDFQVCDGTAVRVMTGAPIPPGTFGMRKQEDCVIHDGMVQPTDGPIAEGAWIRRRGEVFLTGDTVLPAGSKVTPGMIALAASAGISTVVASRPITALHLITGDEVAAAGTPPHPFHIPDSNGPMLRALFRKDHVVAQSLHLGDEKAALDTTVAGCSADLLIISGGSGPGERDFTLQSLETAGFTVLINGINSRPGKPLIFAKRGNQVAFGLPGNPLAHWVCHHAFVRRALARFAGITPQPLNETILAKTTHDSGDGRRTWTPAIVECDPLQSQAMALPWRHSGDLSPLARANALLFDACMKPGERVRYLSTT